MIKNSLSIPTFKNVDGDDDELVCLGALNVQSGRYVTVGKNLDKNACGKGQEEPRGINRVPTVTEHMLPTDSVSDIHPFGPCG